MPIGSDHYWFAIFNKKQKNQSSGLQFFVNVHLGKIGYDIHRYSDNSYPNGRIEHTAQSFDYDELINYFNTYKALILNDIPSIKPSETEKIDIEDSSIYKVSMGAKYFSVQDIEDFINKGQVVVHEDTLSKGKSQISQGEEFSSNVNDGDYFYLTHSNNSEGAVKLIGKFKGEARHADGKYGEEGWLERDFELVKASILRKKYSGTSRWWTPDNNSTFIKVTDINEANELLFKPYFNVEFTQNKNKPEAEAKIEIKPHNIILYGPPGTGKTYHTIDLATIAFLRHLWK